MMDVKSNENVILEKKKEMKTVFLKKKKKKQAILHCVVNFTNSGDECVKIKSRRI